jgi:hypothetical protein
MRTAIIIAASLLATSAAYAQADPNFAFGPPRYVYWHGQMILCAPYDWQCKNLPAEYDSPPVGRPIPRQGIQPPPPLGLTMEEDRQRVIDEHCSRWPQDPYCRPPPERSPPK